MGHSRSRVHETSSRGEVQQDERSALTLVPGGPDESELSFRGIMDTIPGLVWSALPDGCFEFCNQRWLDYAGMSLIEVKNWGWEAAIHPQDVMDFHQKWQAAIREEKSFEAEAPTAR